MSQDVESLSQDPRRDFASHSEGVDRSERPSIAIRLVSWCRTDVPLVLLDASVAILAYMLTLVLRFDGDVSAAYWDNFWTFIPAAAAVHLTSNYVFGLYGQMWRYASVHEARNVGAAGLTAGVAVVLVSLPLGGSVPILPISVLVLGAALNVLGIGAIRFQNRLFAVRRRSTLAEPGRVLVVGAGEAGAMVLKDIFRNPSLSLHPVGFIDDDPRKVGRSLHGVRVLGTRKDIPRIADRFAVDQVLLAIPSATSELVRSVALLAEEADVTVRVLPTVGQIVDGQVGVRDIRDLRIEDLLGRTQVQVDMESVSAMMRGRRVLITGAGGSIGSEIARQVLALEPAKVVLLDHDETHLHDVQLELPEATTLLGDIRDREGIFDIFNQLRPQVVFHAAAHKHVPILEHYPEQALQTNLIGTANVADAAAATGVERFVLISTDKAVKPESVMGASKWFAEQVVRGLSGNGCTFCCVRFGNVLGSRGSVIPTFLRQIAKGGPVTVTDPEMTRYFMSVEEAVQLVLQAGALARGGEVFTLDMGEPVKILDLARRLIRLSGRVPDREIEIQITGVRPGEKLEEDLFDYTEESIASSHPSITVSRPIAPDRATMRLGIWELEMLARESTREELARRMKEIAGRPMGVENLRSTA
jgi:FlaA1/EpsC-like NDP-sugar epimerase